MEYLICIFSGTNFENCFILGRWYIRLGCIICRFSTKTKYFISNYTSSRKINSVHTYKASKSKRKRIYSSYNFKSQCKRIFTKIYTLPINKLQIESKEATLACFLHGFTLGKLPIKAGHVGYAISRAASSPSRYCQQLRRA